MTTRDFIKKTYNITSTKERHCSSVWTDNSGTVYSYGAHYPLLFRVAGRNFINTSGYSNTTSKHIGWAWSAVDYDATAVELDREDARVISSSFTTREQKLKVLARATDAMVARAQEACDSKKRKDTQVYEGLALTLARARASQAVVRVAQLT